jgi:tetraacyldisaccharide 4'-kinase
LLAGLGRRPHFLTRGYGGTAQGPVLVRQGQTAAEVGDEPLLLAQVAPTTVSADRVAGAKTIEATSAEIIVMDDGFQNPSLRKDFSLVVVDAVSGIGNGLVVPAGPLREPLAEQILRADALLVVGEGGKAARIAEAFERANKPVLKARMAPNCDPRWLSVLPVIGFAGIARPSKFFATLSNNGARLIDARAYRDHYRYSPRQARSLLKEARDYKAMLVTTEKDWVRLPEDDDQALAELKHRSRPFPIAIKFEDEARLKELLLAAVDKAKS